jgi:acyl-CoA thioesterase FadM
MDEARFSKRAKPGDEITLELEMTRMRAPLVVFNGKVSVQGQLLARVEGLTLAFGDINAVASPEKTAAAADTPPSSEPPPVASF